MTLLLSVLAASLLGSVHCAAMCGGFVCMYAGTGARKDSARSPGYRAHAAYNGGRLISYVILGAIAGSLGYGVDRVGAIAQVGRLAAIVSGALMVAWGASTLLSALGVRVPRMGASRRIQVLFANLLVGLRGRSPAVRSAATGLLTTLLPCGWLYAFVATAGGTGRATHGMLVMLFFWLGTLPVMTAVGAGAQGLFGSFRRRLPMVSAGVAVVLGLLAIAGKMTVRPANAATHASHAVESAPAPAGAR